jgi:L-fuconolactonase
MRIDAHQHFWQPARGDYFWLTPELVALYRPFGPADLAPLLAAAGIESTILVQAAPTVAETEYMLGIADATPFVAGIVGWIDFDDAKSVRELDRLARHPRFKGVRPMIQDLPDPDWMLRPEIDWAYRALAAHGLAFDALLHPRHLGRLLRLVERHPDLRIVIDHGAKPRIRERQLDEWARDIERVARNSAVCCKLSGLVTEAAPNWREADLAPYVEHLLASFGPERLIFGSDWPVATLGSSYQRWLDTATSLTAHLAAAERDLVFGGNAERFYRL